MKKEDMIRKNMIKENLSLFWNSYQHMYDVRERNIQESINFLLIITTFLPILCITLYTTELFKNIIILIPVIFQIVALLVLLKSFLIKGQKIPWFELHNSNDKKAILDKFNENNFEAYTLAILKAAEGDTYTNLVEKSKIIKHALRFIIFSLYSILISVSFVLVHDVTLLFFIIITITLGLSIFIVEYYLKKVQFNFENNYNNAKKKIDKWLKEGKYE